MKVMHVMITHLKTTMKLKMEKTLMSSVKEDSSVWEVELIEHAPFGEMVKKVHAVTTKDTDMTNVNSVYIVLEVSVQNMSHLKTFMIFLVQIQLTEETAHLNLMKNVFVLKKEETAKTAVEKHSTLQHVTTLEMQMNGEIVPQNTIAHLMEMYGSA